MKLDDIVKDDEIFRIVSGSPVDKKLPQSFQNVVF